MIAKYIEGVQWVEDGMEWPFLNCWGLARLFRHECYGLPLLPRSDGIVADDKAGLTQACGRVVADHLQEIAKPVAGALATSWRGKLCMHVAVVAELEGRMIILESTSGSGCRWMRLHDWERSQPRVKYYHDKH